ncbi:MAG: hypothetical protein KDA57_17815 [Planctomycetales bacterium]|nr:hypothetical protein [Planctomycetales bacterium]
MSRTKKLGDEAEVYAARLLSERGYSPSLLPTNYPTFDIEVNGRVSFNVSVKASAEKQHVRLGARRSAKGLTAGSFVFAFMPVPGSKVLTLKKGGYRLLIVPGDIARDDAIALADSYAIHRGIEGEYGYSLMVKGYSKRPHQVEVWARWAKYEEAWGQLPKP